MTVTVIRSNYGKITMNSTTTAISSLDGEHSSLDIGSLKLKGSTFITPGISSSNVVNNLQNVSVDVDNLNLFDASDGNKRINDMTYSTTESVFVAVVAKGYPLYSSDGENWYRSNTNVYGDYYECLRVIWVEELNRFFLAVKGGRDGTGGGGIWSSQDGQDWTKATHYKINESLGTYYQGSPTTIAYSPLHNLLVAISDGNGTDRVWTSSNNGISFHEVAQEFLPGFSATEGNYHFHSIIWDSVLNIFIIGLSGDWSGSSHDTFWYSSDSEALVWQPFTQVFDDSGTVDTSIQNLTRLAYSSSLDVTVAVGRGIYYTSYGGGPANVANLQWHQTSTVNGQSGTSVDLLDVEWIEALGLFVATGNTNQPVMYSSDGRLWAHANVEVGSTGFLSQPKRSLTYGGGKLIISTNNPNPFIQSTETPGVTTINASCTALNDITDAGSGKIITDAERTLLNSMTGLTTAQEEKINSLNGELLFHSNTVAIGGTEILDMETLFRDATNPISGAHITGKLTIKYYGAGHTTDIAMMHGSVMFTGGPSGTLQIATSLFHGSGKNGAQIFYNSNSFTFIGSSTEVYTFYVYLSSGEDTFSQLLTDAQKTKLDTLPEKITLLSGSVSPGGFAIDVNLNLIFKSVNNAIQGSHFVGILTVKYSAEGQTENIALFRGHVSYTGGSAGQLTVVSHTLQGNGTNGAEMLFESNIFTFNPSATETYRYVITIQE